MARTEIYKGQGYPFVVPENASVTARLMSLFNQRDTWTSAELNKEVGWQFSQGIFHLRRGLRFANAPVEIITERTGPRQFQYKVVHV